ncbi:Translation initiation factor [Fagus crenata]
MAKRRAKKTVKKSESSPLNDKNDVVEKEDQIDKEAAALVQEVERQSAAIRAIRDVEIEHLLTELHLLRSKFNKEQLPTPTLQFFKENFPNLSIVRTEGKKQLEVQWNEEDSKVPMNHADERDIHASLLHQLSMVYPDCPATVASLGGFEFSSKSVQRSLLGAGNLQMNDFVLEEPSETQILGMQDGLRTPGVSSQRLSIGMTPKTLRLPKPGEMLLSVNGSPLGVYKEDNMEAIYESDED